MRILLPANEVAKEQKSWKIRITSVVGHNSDNMWGLWLILAILNKCEFVRSLEFFVFWVLRCGMLAVFQKIE